MYSIGCKQSVFHTSRLRVVAGANSIKTPFYVGMLAVFATTAFRPIVLMT